MLTFQIVVNSLAKNLELHRVPRFRTQKAKHTLEPITLDLLYLNSALKIRNTKKLNASCFYQFVSRYINLFFIEGKVYELRGIDML